MTQARLSHSPNGSTTQSINHQGWLQITAGHCERYRVGLAKRKSASALAGVEGFQLNPSQGAGVPKSGAPAKGSCLDFVDYEAEIKRIQYPPSFCKFLKLSDLIGGVTAA